MPFIRYTAYEPRGQRQLDMLRNSIAICEQMEAQGFRLTVRQLHYQFVSRGLYDNTQQNYKALGDVVSLGRRGGYLNWDWIEDRTRFSNAEQHFAGPADLMKAAAESYQIDKWLGQEYRPEVWVEKDALIGVIEGVCVRNDVTYTACRGYSSDSEMWRSAMRLRDLAVGRNGATRQVPFILHLGDHDPSGIDMTRDVQDRLSLFWKLLDGDSKPIQVPIVRLALNMDQILQYSPPENFAKLTDSRAGVIRNKAGQIVGIKPGSYIDQFSKLDGGHNAVDRAQNTPSWELDALDPPVIVDLIQDAIDDLRDGAMWREKVAAQERDRDRLRDFAARWDDNNKEGTTDGP
jgi:hypothetical protein